MSETDPKPDPLLELLRRSPNCRVTITFGRRKRRKGPAKPKPKPDELRQRGWSWYRWDYSRTREGHAIVGSRGAYRWGWHYERDATPEEYARWKQTRKEEREKRAALKAGLQA